MGGARQWPGDTGDLFHSQTPGPVLRESCVNRDQQQQQEWFKPERSL